MTTTESYLDSETSSVKNKIQAVTGKDAAQILNFCDTRLKTAKNSRLRFEQEWFLNIAFFFGRQYVMWNKNALQGKGGLHEPPSPPWRVRQVINKIRPMIRGELSKITQEKPQPFVIPASTEEADIAAAKAGEAIWEHVSREIGYNAVIRRAAFWALICGSGFIKDWYDPDIEVTEEITGDVQMEAVTPFHLFVPDMQEEELENQPYVIHSVTNDVDYVNKLYEVNLHGNKGAGSDIIEQRFLSAMGIDAADADRNHVVIHEGWFKPCKQFPNGAKVVWSQDKVLSVEKDEWPFEHGEYPFTKIDHIPSGRFYATSTIEDLRPLQKELNRTRSQIIEAKNRMSKPQLLAPIGSIDPNKVTSEPGLIIFYQVGFDAPVPLPMQNLPNYVTEELDRINGDMNDISSQHEITKGSTPPGVTAATAIAYLQEEDNSRLAPTVASIEEATQKIGRHILSHVQQFWSVKRKIKVMGEDLTYESFAFNSASLRGNLDLFVQAGSAAPRSLAAKRAFLMELGDKGWVDPNLILKYLDMAETGRLYKELRLDENQARRENLKMKLEWQKFAEQSQEVAVDPETGEPYPDGERVQYATIPVNDYDNHAIHIEEHNRYRKTQEYENLPEEAQIVFQTHVDMHQQVMMMSQTGQMMMPGDPHQNPSDIPVEEMGGVPPEQSGQPPQQGGVSGVQ